MHTARGHGIYATTRRTSTVNKTVAAISGLATCVALALTGYSGITTNCFNWAGPCPDGNECCERVDSGQNQAYCKQLCAPYTDVGCCRWTAHWYYYSPVGGGCCQEINNGNPNCWIITDANNLGDAFKCVKQGETMPCNTNTQFGSCISKTGGGGSGE